MANEFVIKNGFHSKGDSQITGSINVTVSGSFSHINATAYSGDGSGLTGLTADTASYVDYTNIVNKPTLLSGSAQIASDISGSFTAASSSFSTRVSTLETNDTTQDSRLNSLESVTGSYATTGSNTFIGEQTVTGSLTVSSSITTNQLHLNPFTGTNPKIHFSGSAKSTIYLEVEESGSISFNSVGSGSLFSITDSLSGSLMSVNDISGLPILEVFSSDRVVAGQFGKETLDVNGLDVTLGSNDTSGSVYIRGGLQIKENSPTPATPTGHSIFFVSGSNKHLYQLDSGGTLTDLTSGSGGGGSGTPGGSTTQVQFNDGGSFGGDADFTWDKTNNILVVNGTISGSVISGSFVGDGSQLTGISGGSGLWTGSAGYISRESDVQITGSLDVTSYVKAPSFSGSFSGSFVGDGSGLTGIVSSSYAVTASYATTAGSVAGGSSRVAGSVQTSTTTPTVVDTIDTLTNEDVHLVEVYVAAKDTGGSFTDWGSTKRTYVITVDGSVANIRHENADVDKWSATLGASSVSASVNGANVDIYVIGTANTIDWVSAYEIVVNS